MNSATGVQPIDRDADVPLQEFEARCRGLLDSRLPRSGHHAGGSSGGWGEGPDTVPTFESPDPETARSELAVARAWLAELAGAGLAWIDGPREYGGAGLSEAHRQVFDRVAAEYQLPKLDTMFITLGIVAPGVFAGGSEQLKREVLPRLHRADLVACQLFSEPGAGSDLSAVTTRAVREGDEWRITGQKVWSSGAHVSDVGLLLARTGDDEVAYRRLTMFLIDMHDSAVTVRPLREMSGGAHFNEVFIDDLRVSDNYRVGDIGGGWTVAMSTLGGERKAVGDSTDMPNWEVVRRLVELARHVATTTVLDDAVRDAVMRCYALGHALEQTAAALNAKHVAGQPPGPEMSMLKLLRNRLLRQATDTAAILLGPAMTADTGEWGTFAWGDAAVRAPGLRIGGGTDEIQRNVLAERVLGLPKEPRGRAR